MIDHRRRVAAAPTSALLVAGLFACTPPAAPVALGALTPPSPSAPTGASCAGDAFSDAYMRGVIETLTQPAWAGRKFDSDGLVQATHWLRDQFACIGLEPGAPALGLTTGGFEQPFETDGDEIDPAADISGYTFDQDATYRFTNVVGTLPGRGRLAAEVIVVGAHLDHLGTSGKQHGALVVGADDDASGVLALLAIARQLASEPAPPERRTIVFAGWGIEEDPFYVRGSQALFEAVDAADPSAAGRIMYYVNFDMIGAYRDHGNVNVMGTFDATPGTRYGASPARRLMTAIAARHPEVRADLGDRGEASDHQTFCEHGIPYAFFWTEDDCYHQACDTAPRIDYEHLASILRIASELTLGLAVAPDLATARREFPAAYRAAYPGETCATQD